MIRIVLFICFLSTTKVFCQEIINHDHKLRFVFHNGLSFTNNERIINTYNKNTFYNYGFGIRLGNPEINKFIPFITYERMKYSSYVIKNQYTNEIETDSSIRINQFTTGAIFPIYCNHTCNISVHTGINFGKQKEASLQLNELFYGFKIGMHYETRINKKLRYFLGFEYDLNDAFKKNRNAKNKNNESVSNNLQNIRWTRLKFGILL